MREYQSGMVFPRDRSLAHYSSSYIYINDIPQLTKGRSIMYADDTSILNVEQDMNELQRFPADMMGYLTKS
jgi:hypothetical protein